MSHVMTDGRPCGRPPYHEGQHRSEESMLRRRRYSRAYGYIWRGTAAGVLSAVRSNAKRRGNR
jgi:hypothetical protein